MANLGPLQQNLTYGNLLQVDGGLTGDLKPVLDGDGNASGLSLSFTAAAISGLVTDIASNLYGGAPGSIPYQAGENDTNFVPAGAAGTVLASTGGGAPSWVNTIQYAVNSNIANKLNGGTVGQIPYQTSASNTGFLPVGTVGQVLVSNGAAAPSWTTSVASALAATAAANVAGGSSGNLLYQSATGLTDYVTNGTTGQILKSQGASAPLWSTLTAADVSAVPIDGSLAMTGNLSMGGHTITNLLNPLASTDAATKAYVDSVATGLNIKASCRVASTTNLVLSGLIAVDGVTVSSGDRVLIKDQTAQDTNGIYVANAGSWTRATDADSWSELVGATTFISAGSTQANTTWACNVTAGGTIGVTPVTFVLFGASASYTAGTGLTLVGSQFALATPVSVANGGSGVTTLTGIVKGNGSSAFTAATGADVVSLIGTTAVQNATTSTACSGNAATATKLQTPTSINGVSFDGSAASYTITASSPASLTVTNNGFGDTSPFLFNGSTAKTISWNSIGTVSNSSAGLTNPSAWRTNLGASTIGENLFTLANPGAVTFPRFNADNTVSVLGAEAAINALLPSQTGNSGKVLTTNGTSAEWGAASSYNPASVAITGGTINGVSLGATTPITSLTTSGAVNFSSYITVDPLVAAYFTNPRIWDSSQTHWYRITPSELADNRYITLPILNTNDTFVFNNNTATLTNKTISGANNAFSNIGNAALTNSSITINGTSVSLGGSITVSGVGTVTSVDLSAPTGLTVSGGPITSSGTLAIALQSGYSIPTTTSQTNWDTAFNVRYRWDGGSTGLVPVTGRTSLQLGTTDTPQFAGLVLSNKIRLGSTDYTWSSSISSLDVKNGSFYGFDNGAGIATVGIARNLYLNSSNQWTYKTSGYGSVYFQSNTGDHSFYVTGTSGTAGTAATLNTSLNVLANRNVECKANLDVTNAISINGSYGSTGQVLTSGGGGAMTWTAPAGSSGGFALVGSSPNQSSVTSNSILMGSYFGAGNGPITNGEAQWANVQFAPNWKDTVAGTMALFFADDTTPPPAGGGRGSTAGLYVFGSAGTISSSGLARKPKQLGDDTFEYGGCVWVGNGSVENGTYSKSGWFTGVITANPSATYAPTSISTWICDSGGAYGISCQAYHTGSFIVNPPTYIGNGLTTPAANATYSNARFMFGTNTAPTYTMMSAANVYSNSYVWGYGPTTSGSNQVFAVQQNSGSYLGVQLTWGSTSWGTMSDERRKDIIEPISNAISKVSSLRSVIGRYKTDDLSMRRSMLIAQDFASVFPEALEDIDIGEEKYLGLRYTDVIPLLVAAIKELSAKVTALENNNG